jgi:hypothetical protein
MAIFVNIIYVKNKRYAQRWGSRGLLEPQSGESGREQIPLRSSLSLEFL